MAAVASTRCQACTALADALMRQCAHLRIPATSREHLGIAGELFRRLPSFAGGWTLKLAAPSVQTERV
jgi:hypothetical protein